MERTVILFLAFTASALAGPISDIASRDTCSTTCTDSTKFGYQPGTTYEYDYDVDTTTLIQGATEGKSGMKMTAKVQVEVLSKCDLVLKVNNVQLHERNPESPENFLLSTMSGEFSRQLEEHSLRFSFQDGRIESLCPADGEKSWVLNIKRGILSMIQNTMENLQADQKVNEADVTGTCDADYTVAENGWYSVTIKKHKNLLGCTERHGYQTAIQGTPYRVPSEIQSLPIMKSSHDCQQEISKSGIVKGSSCTEQHVFRPFSRDSSGAMTESKQTLKYSTEKAGVSKPKSVNRKADMTFEHNIDTSSNTKARKNIEKQLVNICAQTKGDVRPETPRLFSDLVYIMKAADSQTLKDVYTNVQSGALCSDNNQKVRKYFLDAVPMTGTPASVSMLTKMVTDNEVTGIEADMWMTTLAFIPSPTKDMIKEVLPLLKKNGKALLAVSSLVNTYCKNARCENDMDVANVISALEDKIGYGCYVDDNNKENIVMTLRALGNSGYISSATSTVNSCISRKDNPMEVRIAAIEAFRRASCDNDRSEAVKVFNDKEEDAEIRIAAYLAMMQCPSESTITTVRNALEKEEVNQVGSFIWSHLTNLMESSSPLKQDIISILNNEYLKKEFDMDKRKYSRNYEGSFFLEKINTGASVESNLIWSSKSFIPRSLMANLTVDLFGKSVNILEVGGRVEGLEYFLESYFGPNGYFTEKDVKDATTQVVKGIDGKKMKKIDSQFGSGMDKLKGALYMRIFGNELSYNSFDGLDSFSSGFNVLEMLISMSKNHDYTFTQNIMFMDTSMIIPTSAGFPLNLTINGTATVDMKASGKVDLRKLGTSPRSLFISGLIQPSTAVEISSMMSVDAFVTKSGLKMVSTVHSSTLLQGHVELKDGAIFNANLDMPKDKMEIFSVKTAFFTVHRDVEKEQNMITKNRQVHKTCTGPRLSQVTGLKLCGEVQFPNASLESSAPYFPLTGPISLDVSLLKEDDHKSYNIEARFTKTKKDINIRMAFDTPGSKTDRALSAEFLLDKVGSKVELGLQSPWNKAIFTGKVENQKNLRHISGKFVYNKREYSVVAEVAMTRKGSMFEYTPHVEITAPKMKSIQLKGGMKYSGLKLIDANLILIGVSKQPIKAEVNFSQKRVVVIGKASISFEKKKEYAVDARVQKYATAKAARYRPYLSIKTPEKELITFGGSTEYKKGKAIKVDLTVDRIVSKPIKLFVQIRDASNKKSTGFRSKVDIKSPVFTTKLTSMFMIKNNKIAIVRSTLDYVIPKISRDKVTLNGKLNVANTKSLSAAKGNIILSFKQQSDYNLNAKIDVSKNWKHSEATMTVVYGPNKKDKTKQIEFKSTMNHILNWKQQKFNLDATTKFIFPYMGVNYQMKGKHAQTSKSIDSTLDVVLGKKSSYSAALELKDKSKKLSSFIGKISVSIPGRDIVIGNVFDQTTAKKYSNVLTVQLENGKKSIIQSTLRNVGKNEYDISTSLNIPSYELLTLSGQYRLIARNVQANSEIKYGQTKYAVSLSSLIRPGSRFQVAGELEYPSRKMTAEFDAIMKNPILSSKLDVKWDANRDLTKNLLIQGEVTYDADLKNVEARLSQSSPLGSGNVNVKHLAGDKYVSHAHVEWNKDMVSIDSVLGKKNDGYNAVLKIESPFKNYKSISIGLDHQTETSKIISSIDVDWKPMKRMSSTLTMKRPFNLNDLALSLEFKSSVPGFEKSGIELTHKKAEGITNSVKIFWNKDFLQTDLLAAYKGTSSTRDLSTRFTVESTLKQIHSLHISAKHADNGKKFENNAKFEHNGQEYGYQGEFSHFRNGWKVTNSGNIKLTSPLNEIITGWSHQNAENKLASLFKFESGANVIDVKVQGTQQMSFPKGTMSFDFALRTPLDIARNIAIAISHKHEIGMIDNKMHYSRDGRKIVSLSNVYNRNNGVAASNHVFSCHGDTKTLAISSQYQGSPMTGQIEYQNNGKSIAKLDGVLDYPTTGLISGKLEMTSQIVGYENIKISMDQSNERGETVTRSSLVLPSRNTITMESRHQWNNKKSFSTSLSTPYKNLQKMSFGADFSGDLKSFHSSANLMIAPMVGPLSVTSQWSSYGGIIATVQINTPFEQHKKTRVSFTHHTKDEDILTELNVEYLPEKLIKLESMIRPNPKNLEGRIALTTPFQSLPYSAASLRHSGDSRQFQCHGEIEYTRGKKIQGDITFRNGNKMEGTFVVRSPFAKDFTAAMNHEGTLSQFASHAEMQYGKSKKYEITGNYGNLRGGLEIKSPLHDDISASFNHKGDISEFDTHVEGLYGRGKKYELNAKYSPISGQLELKSPVHDDIKASFNHQGKLTDFQSQAEIQYGKSKKYEALVKLSLAKVWVGTVSFASPITDDVSISFSREGELKDFKIGADGKYGKMKGSIAALFKKAKKTTGSLELKSTLIDNIKAEFSHEGSLRKFNSKASLTKAGKTEYEGSVSFSNGKKVQGSVTLKSPFHRDISATIKHSGDLSGFKTAAEIKMDKKSEYKLLADMVSKKQTKVKVTLENPFTNPITLSFVKKGKPTNIRMISNAILGKGQKYTADLTLKRGSNTAVIVGVTTPIAGYKKMKGTWKFSGNKKSFKTSVLGSLGKESISADLKMSLRPSFKADIAIETPFKGLKKAGVVLSHQGSLDNFKSHAEVSVGKSKLYNADIMMATDPKMAASFNLQTPFRKLENIDLSITQDGSLRNFNNQMNLVLNKKKFSSSLKMDTRSDIAADISIQTPFEGFEVLQGSLAHSGNWNDFQFHVEGLDGTNNKFTGDLVMQLKNQVICNMKLTTPFKSVQLLKASLSHDGTLNNFHSHAEFEHNNDKSEIDVNFSSLIKLEGRALVKSAYIDTIEGVFAHENNPFATTATLTQGNNIILDGQLYANFSPLQGSVQLNSMFTKPLKASLRHTGTMNKFNTYLEINYGKEYLKHTTKFDSSNDISASTSTVTSNRHVKNIEGTLSHEGRWSNFKCHAVVSINGETVEGDVAFNSQDMIEGTFALKTPFENYREGKISLQHKGGLRKFNSHAEYSLEGKKSDVQLTFDIVNKIDINVLIRRPSVNDIALIINHEGNGREFTSKTELRYGGENKIQGGVHFETEPKMNLAAFLRSKCPVVKNVEMTIAHEGSVEKFNVRASASFNDQKIASDVRLDSSNGLNGLLSLTTPVSEEIRVLLRHDGPVSNFKTIAEVSYSGKKQIEMDASFDSSSSITGQITMKTPIRKISNIEASFVHDGDFNDFKCTGSASIRGEQKISGDISFKSQPLSGGFNVKSVFGELNGAFNHELSPASINSHAEINVNGKPFHVDVIYSSSGMTKGSISLSTPFSGKVGTSFTLKQGTQQISGSVTVFSTDKTIIGSTEMSFEDGFTGKVSLNTPVKGYEQQSILAKYENTNEKLSSSITVEYKNGQQISGQISLSKRGSMKGNVIVSTPFEGFRDMNADFTYALSSAGLIASAKGTFRQQSISSEVNFEKNPIQGRAILRTPFAGFEEMKTSFNHVSTDRGYRSHGEVTVRGKTFQIDSAFSNKNSISAALSIKTPIEGYKVLSVSINHNNNIKGFSNVAKAGVENNEVSVETTFTRIPNLAGDIKITTPFSGFEKQSGSFILNKNNINVESTIRGQKIEFDGTQDNGNRRISFTTPFDGFKSQKLEVKRTEDTINARGSFRGKTIEVDSSFPSSNGFQLSVKTPFKGFEEQRVSMNLEETLTGYQMQAENTFQNKKIELTARFRRDSDVSGELEVTSSYSGFERQKISVISRNGKMHAMVEFMQETIEVTGQYLPGQGLLSIGTTFPGFESQKLSLNFDDNKLHAEGLFRQKTIEIDGELSASKGRLSIATPFSGFKKQYISFSTDGQKFHAEGSLMEKTIEIDGELSASRGRLSIATPFSGFKKQHISFTIDGQKLHAEGSLMEKTVEIDGELSTSKGSLVVVTPFSGFENQYVRFTKEEQKLITEVLILERKIEVDAFVNIEGKIEGEIEVRSPFEGFVRQALKFSHQRRNGECLTHADILFREEKYDFDLSIITELKKEFKISLKTPITGFEEQLFCIEAGQSPNGRKIHSEVHFDKKKIEADFDYEIQPTLSANMVIKTPFDGFESTSVSFHKEGSLKNMQLSSRLTYGASQTISLSLRNIIEDASSEHVLKFQSPYTDISAMHKQSSDNGVLRSQSDLSMGNQFSFSHRNLLQYSTAPMLDFTATTTYTIDGETSTTETKINHVGGLSDFKTGLVTRYESEEATLSVQFKNTNTIEGSLSINSPFPYLRNVNAKFSHSGDQDQFSTSGDFQHETIGTMEGKMTFFRQNWRRINSNLVIKTPFAGFEQTALNIKHSANRNSIKSFVDVSYGNDQTVRASIKGSLEPMEVDLLFTSPFKAMENLHASAKSVISGEKYDTELMMSSQNKAISLKSALDLESTPMALKLELTTPFSGLETSKLVITNKGSLLDFTSSIDLQSFWVKMKSDASLKYSALSDFESLFSLSSDMTGFENLKFALKNEQNDGELKNQMTASWKTGKRIVSSLTYSSKDTWGTTTRKGHLVISTPFSQLRELSLESNTETATDSIKQVSLAEVNGAKVLDVDLTYRKDAQHTASLVMREPQPIELKSEVLVSDTIKSGKMSVNLDTTSSERQAEIEMKYTTDPYNQKRETVVKIVTPSRSVEVRGSGEKTSSRFFSSWDTVIDNVQLFGFDVDHTLAERRNNYENSNNLKLRFPERSIAMTSTYQEKYGRKKVEGSLLWDADRDQSKKIGASASIVPQGDSLKADVSFEIPSIGKDVKLDSEMTLNSGNVLFDGKTEFKYSKDEDKTVVINSRIEDISTYSNKNFTFSFGVRHVFSSVDIQLNSHIGKSDDKYSSGINVNYLTAKRTKKNFALMGEIDSLRRKLNVEVVSPMKSLRMSGDIETSPYRLRLRNVYDDTKEINSLITLDTDKKVFEAQTSYDIENPANVLHFVAKYVNASAILAEVYREENSRRITDSLFAMRLNTSRILHTRLHWRPTLINDLKVSGLGKISLYSRKINQAFSEVAVAVGEELNSKYNLVREAASTGFRPYGMFLEDILKNLAQQFPSADLSVLRNLIKSNKVQWEDFPGKDKYDLYVEFMKDVMTLIESRGGYYYAELMDVISQQFEELSASIEYAMKKYDDTMSKISENQVSEYLKTKYDSLLTTAKDYPVADIASQYTNAIYDVRDKISSRMNGPVLRTLKEVSGQSYQLAHDAYIFWEVEENVKAVTKNIFEMVKKDIEEEFALLKSSITNLRNSKITVFDVKSGELQMDTYLPFAMSSLQELPTISISKFTNKLHSYIPKYSNRVGSLSSLIPDSDVSNWIPPFKAVAYLRGDRFTTFDGKEFDFSGKCSYVLTRDYMDGNFSVIVNYLGKNKKQIIVTTATNTLQIAPNGKLRVNGNIVKTPYQSSELSIKEDDVLTVFGRGFSVEYNIPKDEMRVVVSGWYHGRLGGLFGTNNNEEYDDMMTSSRRTVVDVDPFVNSWEVDSKCR